MGTVWNDADIPGMLAGAGALPCTIGGVSGIALLDEEEQVYGDRSQGEVTDQVTSITIQTSAFPSARIDDTVTIDGRTGSIMQRLKIGDGGLTRILFSVDAAIPIPPGDNDVILDGGGTPP